MPPANENDSLSRRLAFAGDSYYFFDSVFCRRSMARFSRIGDSQTARIPDHAAKIVFDLVECLRTRRKAPDIGNVELALLHASDPVPQHPRYLSYWHDPSLHSMVGMIVGIDLIHFRGKYHVIELNHGPSIYPRRRQMYDTPFDPMFSRIFDAAIEDGYRKIVPIAFRWDPLYVAEFERASREYGIPIVPFNCPLQFPETPNRMFGLPDPLEANTLYVIHSGLMTPAFRYLDNKWYSWKWLESAIENELPKDTLVSLPATHDDLDFALEDHGPRWPNLIVKLSASARSRHVIAARFESTDEARQVLGIDKSNGKIPKPLRSGFLNEMLFYGREHVLYQAFLPPDLDAAGHAQMIRLHMFVSPTRTMYLSSHIRQSRKPVPDQVPRGILSQDDSYIFNNADYVLLTPEMEADIRAVAVDLGGAMQRAVARKFETGP